MEEGVMGEREEREGGQKVRDVKIMPVKMLTILCSYGPMLKDCGDYVANIIKM